MVIRNKAKRIGVLLTFLVMVAVNAMANILPLNNITTGEVSDNLFNLFAPTGLTFSIWGVIYLLLFGYSLFQMKVEQDLSVRQNLMDDIALFFIVSNIANTLWVFAWHYGYVLLSLVLIIIVLLSLIFINNEIKYGSLKGVDYLLIKAPFGIYFGWITVASIANVTAYLVSVNFDGLGLSEPMWTIIMLVVSLLIGAATMIMYKSLSYGLVLLWAYAGIYLRHTQDLNNQYPSVVIASIVCFVLYLLVWAGFSLKLNSKSKEHAH